MGGIDHAIRITNTKAGVGIVQFDALRCYAMSIWDGIQTSICLHALLESNDTPFWKPGFEFWHVLDLLLLVHTFWHHIWYLSRVATAMEVTYFWLLTNRKQTYSQKTG